MIIPSWLCWTFELHMWSWTGRFCLPMCSESLWGDSVVRSLASSTRLREVFELTIFNGSDELHMWSWTGRFCSPMCSESLWGDSVVRSLASSTRLREVFELTIFNGSENTAQLEMVDETKNSGLGFIRTTNYYSCIFERCETIPREQRHHQHLEYYLSYGVHPIFAD